ncbi:MAG: hypothetical protein IH994_02250 [Proteobacteria bacterium]|nr:hypothetical protein [Pseudomonadota bacterium]
MTNARKGKPARKKTAVKSKAKARPRKAKPEAKPRPAKTAPEAPPPGAAGEQAAQAPPRASIGDAPPEADAPAPAAQARQRSGGWLRVLGLLGFLVVIGIGAGLMNWPFWAEILAPYWSGVEAEPAETPAAEVPAAEVPAAAIPMTAEKGGQSIEEMRTERQQLRQELNRLMARMETIEKSIDSVKKLIQVTTSASEKGGAGKIPAALAERLSKMEESGESIKSLLQRMDKLESDSAAQTAYGAGAEPNVRAGGGQSAQASSRARAIVLAVANLRQAVATDEPFEKTLEVLNVLSGDDPDIKSAVVVLSKSSVAGIPTLATLRERFDGLAGKIVQASKTLEETGWMERATNRIMSLVTWRRVGAGAGAGAEASSIDAIVAGAEARLGAGDLKGAIDALKGLSSHAKAAKAAAPWLRDAKARVVAERAVATLHVHAVFLLAPGKG